jgi:hypothetical protein
MARRRTFGIISHPDAGKTTLTEKLLLFSCAIQMAGAVKARAIGIWGLVVSGLAERCCSCLEIPSVHILWWCRCSHHRRRPR